MTPEERVAAIGAQRRLVTVLRRGGKPDDPGYLDAVEQLNDLEASGLEFWASVDAIREAAEARRFLTYGDIAAASGRLWKNTRRAMPQHLGQLCRWAHGKGWPLITAIVVEKPHLASGRLGEQTLAGFVAIATELRVYRAGTDRLAFLAAEQARVFDWAATEAGRDLRS